MAARADEGDEGTAARSADDRAAAREAEAAAGADAAAKEAYAEREAGAGAAREEEESKGAAAEREAPAGGRGRASRKRSRPRTSLKESRRGGGKAADTAAKRKADEEPVADVDTDEDAPQPAAADGDERATRGFATEAPVIAPHPPRTSEYVVTADNRTGLAVRIERLDPESGARTEISAAEYALIYPFGRPADPTARRGTGAMGSGVAEHANGGETAAADSTLLEAYYRGVADYLKALTRGR